MIDISRLQRRTFLRGLGTALALPALDSALPRSLWAATARAAMQPPVRMAFLFVPNGVNMEHWMPAAEGRDFALPSTLEPLAPLREKLLVLSGLAQDTGFAHGDGAGDHARSAATFLTGVHPVKTDGKGLRAGVSVDQVAAQHFGAETRFDSLALGCEPGKLSGSCDSGYACAYSNNISWRSAVEPTGKEISPRQLFDRLFGAGSEADVTQSRAKRDLERKSILDLVQQDARRMRRKLGGDDRQRLDQYLDGIREIERRIDQPSVEDVDADLEAPPHVAPRSFAQHAELMGDLLAVAFQADLTRVASWMFANEGSVRTFRRIGVSEGHHTLSHHENLPEKKEKIAQIDRYYIEQFARFLKRLDEVKEGDGTLLDNSMIVYGGGISDGNAHNHDNLPVLVAGRGGGAISGGRHVKYAANTPLMNLYLQMLHSAGVNVAALGDSTGPLKGLDA
jgi:hypothetical protein